MADQELKLPADLTSEELRQITAILSKRKPDPLQLQPARLGRRRLQNLLILCLRMQEASCPMKL